MVVSLLSSPLVGGLAKGLVGGGASSSASSSANIDFNAPFSVGSGSEIGTTGGNSVGVNDILARTMQTLIPLFVIGAVVILISRFLGKGK